MLLPRNSAEALRDSCAHPCLCREGHLPCLEAQALTLRSSSKNSPVTSGRLEKVYWTLPNIPRGTRAVGKGGSHRAVLLPPHPCFCPKRKVARL